MDLCIMSPVPPAVSQSTFNRADLRHLFSTSGKYLHTRDVTVMKFQLYLYDIAGRKTTQLWMESRETLSLSGPMPE